MLYIKSTEKKFCKCANFSIHINYMQKYITSINQFVLYYSNSVNIYQHKNVSNTDVDERKYFVCNTPLPLSLMLLDVVKKKCANAYISKWYTFLALMVTLMSILVLFLGVVTVCDMALKQLFFWQFPLPWFCLPKMDKSSSQSHYHMSECLLYNSTTFWFISLQLWRSTLFTANITHLHLVQYQHTKTCSSIANFFTINSLFQLFTSLKYGIPITYIVDNII